MHIFKTALFHVLSAIAVLSAFSSCSQKKVRTDSLPPCAVTADLDSIFRAIFPDEDGPGGIAVVMRNDTIVYRHSFGMADLQTKEAITDSTLFNLSSASKIFTSAALLKLCEQGLLSLDDTLAKFFPEFNPEVFSPITIRHILTHSSGLPDPRPSNRKEWNKYTDTHHSVFVNGKDYALYGDEGEHMLSFQNLTRPEFEPGTHYNRQDPAYILVAPLIEKMTGSTFEEWMDRNIFKPAGTKETFYYSYMEKMPVTSHAYRSAEGLPSSLAYRSEDGRWEEYDFGEAPFFLTRADRGIYSSARDFMLWNRALYSGKIISDSSLKVINTPYIPTNIPMVSFGLGTAVREEPGFPLKSYHMNRNGAYSIAEGTWPDERLHYIVFSNRADWNYRKVTASIDSVFKAKGFIR